MPEQGTLAITARGDGSRWYGRISIPESVARKAGLVAGTRVTARCCEGVIVIHADEQGRIRFPAARGKSHARHAFEAATSTLGLRDTPLSQTLVPTEVEEGSVMIRVPEGYLAEEVKLRRRPRKEPPRPEITETEDVPVVRTVGSGAAAALVTEATRVGKVVRPLSLPEAIRLVEEAGNKVEILGPRIFRLNGTTASLSDLAEVVSRVSGSTDQNKIVIVLN
jgi:hypothetical protein